MACGTSSEASCYDALLGELARLLSSAPKNRGARGGLHSKRHSDTGARRVKHKHLKSWCKSWLEVNLSTDPRIRKKDHLYRS